jgi:hypothetical protein
MVSHRGRAIGRTTGTHAALIDLVVRNGIPRGSVLDLGTHAGALLLRPNDAGLQELSRANLEGTRFDVLGAGGPSVVGESLIVPLRRAEPDPALRNPTDYRDSLDGISNQIGIE